jgi:hypothetical protein
MIFRTVATAAGAALLLTVPAFAEGWNWSAVRNQTSIDQCKAHATESFDTYADAHTRRSTGESNQTIYAYDLGGDGVDAVVWCIRRPDGSVDALLITHSRDGEDSRRSPTHTLMRAMMRDLTDN